MDLAAVRKQVDTRLAELAVCRKQYRQECQQLAEAEAKEQDLVEAQQMAQQVAQRVQQQAHGLIAGVVSRSLEAVFDDPYACKIIFEQKRGRTEATLVFDREGMEVDPKDGSGGGVVDVAAFALRLSCLLLAKPPLCRLLVLDEPFKFVSADYRGRVRVLLETLAAEMQVQTIMVTHIDELKTGNVIDLG